MPRHDLPRCFFMATSKAAVALAQTDILRPLITDETRGRVSSECQFKGIKRTHHADIYPRQNIQIL